MPGQGQSGKSIGKSRVVDLEACKSSCREDDECIAIDFTSADLNSNPSLKNCRLYGENIPRSSPGSDNRQYCTVEKCIGKMLSKLDNIYIHRIIFSLLTAIL